MLVFYVFLTLMYISQTNAMFQEELGPELTKVMVIMMVIIIRIRRIRIRIKIKTITIVGRRRTKKLKQKN